jgi:hypothetical protein
MAIQISDAQFGSVVIPGAITRINVRTPATGLGAFGVVAIVGEADQGPATGATGEDIETNFYTPGQIGNILAKYGSGNIVEAFKALAAPSNDNLITGSVTRIYVYKTNPSTAASSVLPTIGGDYATLEAISEGVLGNQLKWTVSAATSAVHPATDNFSYVPVAATGTSALLKYRISGGSQVTGTISPNQTPTAVAAALSAGDLMATGGVDRSIVSGLSAVTATLVASGSNISIQLGGSSVYPATAVIGDLLVIPSDSLYGSSAASVLATGSLTANAGAYVVTGVSNIAGSAILSAVKLSDNVSNTVLSAPVSGVAVLSTTVTNDLQVYSPLKFTVMSGLNRSSLVGLTSSGVTVTASGSNLQVNVSNSKIFAVGAAQPQVGDNMYIPSGSVVAGAGSANVGWYALTAVNNVTGTCYVTGARLSNGSPVSVASATITSSPDADIKILRPWIDGQIAGLEMSDNGGNTALTATFRTLGTDDPADFISSESDPTIVVGTEYQATVDIARSSDNLLESYVGLGGEAVLYLGYLGTTASVNVSSTQMAFTVTGGAGADLTINLSNYPNLTSLAEFISSQTGYAASVASNALGALPPAILDKGTFGCCSSVSEDSLPCTIKRDAFNFVAAVSGSPTVEIAEMDALAGLPEPQSVPQFFSGGAKNGTTGAAFNSAVDELAKISCNFVIPLFSRNASEDIADSKTESSSTYTIAAINAYVKSHCLAMSTPKRKKNRLGMCSFKGTFAQAKAEAQSLASARTALAFQDVKAVSMAGAIEQFQPWMLACVAGGMQAIGLYRSISRKFANVSGIVNPSGFSPKDDGQLEDALLSGMLVLEAPVTGGFRFVSDQTTYGKDANFVFNSLQVMYTSDYMAIDLANSFDNFAVGQAVSDISAGSALVFLQTKMGQYYANKLIASSDGAAAGYNSATVTIDGPVMRVGVNAYVTNAIQFVLISFDVSQVSQSAE